MQILNHQFDLDEFFNVLDNAEQRALLLDYDGTLAPFQTERDQAFPYPGIREILDGLIELQETRIAVITGRQIDDILPLLGLQRQPEVWGSHGWEHLATDGTYGIGAISQQEQAALDHAKSEAESASLTEYIEIKPRSIALHWRGAGAAVTAERRQWALRAWSGCAEDVGLNLQEFDGGIELHIPGKTKGDSVRAILNDMDSAAVIAYLGDDLTDEDAFKALEPPHAGVLVRPEFRSTAADVWIQPPHELLHFLQRWLQLDKGELCRN